MLLRKGIAKVGERLPRPTNAGSHVPEVRQGDLCTAKHMEVPSRTVRDVTDRLEYSNPFIDIEEAGSSGQKRKAGERNEDAADGGREPDHAGEPEAQKSRVGDIVSRQAELLRMFEDLCDRASEYRFA